MSRDYRLYLDDMLESARKVLGYTHGMGLEQFKASDLVREAVAYNLQTIGEAASHIPAEVRVRGEVDIALAAWVRPVAVAKARSRSARAAPYPQVDRGQASTHEAMPDVNRAWRGHTRGALNTVRSMTVHGAARD